MTDIDLDPGTVQGLIDRQLEATNALDRRLNAMPAAPDGGLASAIIGFLVSAAAEGASLAADSSRGVSAIATDIVTDLTMTDAEASAALNDFTDELDAS